MSFTQEQILQLAPDDASAKAGSQLANKAKWVLLASHEKALWGDCQGSGSSPYKTMVDLGNLAFKCSCPSRKFPCKHGLGLMLLFAKQPQSFNTESTLAPHVEEWILKRTTKAETKEIKEQKPVDEAAKQKRVEAREKKVLGGIEELRTWLKDVVRTGIVNVPQNPYQFNQTITARMNDAQASGLAAQLRKINKINFYGENWQKSLTKQLAKTYLLTEAYLRSEQIEGVLKEDLTTLIGWNTPKEEVLNTQGILDDWYVLSKTLEEEDKLTTERVWLYGTASKRMALILNFYAFNQLPQNLLAKGSKVKAEMFFYPSVLPFRALLKQQLGIENDFLPLEGTKKIEEALNHISDSISNQPFIDKIPLILNDFVLLLKDNKWWLGDAFEQYVSLENTVEEAWNILAISQGKPFDCFVIYEDEKFIIHTLWSGNSIYFIK